MTFRSMVPFLFVSLFGLFVTALVSPTNQRLDITRLLQSRTLQHRTTPFFPDTPASCPICAQVCDRHLKRFLLNYAGINSCVAAAPVLANSTMVIFNPGAFIDVIKCACTDTFQSTYPQCVDCFSQTNQMQYLNTTEDLPTLVSNIRKICSVESSLLGNVSETNGEVTPAANAPAPTITSAASHNVAWVGLLTLVFGITLIGVE